MDERDVARYYEKYCKPYKVDEKNNKIILTTDDGEVMLPLEFEVCRTCEGRGTHVNPSIDSHGLSGEDFAEDPEFAEDYFSGRYDMPCNECHGKRVTPTSSDSRFKTMVQEAWSSAIEAVRSAEMGF